MASYLRTSRGSELAYCANREVVVVQQLASSLPRQSPGHSARTQRTSRVQGLCTCLKQQQHGNTCCASLLVLHLMISV